MRILACNDDGIDSPGLRLAAEIARGLTDDVWIVAPERKWTAASHQVTFDRDLTLTRRDHQVYACSGAPAVCVIAALALVFAEAARPDLVLAGVNDKRNVGEDAAYSGTMSIAREATFAGLPAIALSRSGPRWPDAPKELAALRRLLASLWGTRGEWSADAHWLAVNLPTDVPAPLRAARIGRDKIASAVDVLDRDAERIVFRLRRGRPGTITQGDENDALAQGALAIVRHGWRDHAPIAAELLARLAAASADDDATA